MNAGSMVQRCSVPHCSTVKPGDGISIYGLPLEPGMRSLWLRALLEETGQVIFREEDKICSKHFTQDSFDFVNGLAVLRPEAIPFRSCTNIETPPSTKRTRIEEVYSESRRSLKRSSVWEYFTQLNENTATCHLCSKDFKFVGGTSNLREHLKRMHPGLLETDNNPPKDNSDQTTTSNPSSPHFSSSDQDRNEAREQQPKGSTKKLNTQRYSFISVKEKEDLDMSLVKMLVSDYQPLEIVNDVGFQAFVKKLQPCYTLPTETVLSVEMLPSIYDKVNIRLRELLIEVSYVALSTDIWTHENNSQYITLTSHCIHEGQLINANIATNKLPASNDIAWISSLLYKVLLEWQIHSKVTCIVNNSENVMQAIGSDQYFIRHYMCIAYTLNNCLREVLESTDIIKTILNKCRNILMFAKQNNSMGNVFHKGSPSESVIKCGDAGDWQGVHKTFEKMIQLKNDPAESETLPTLSMENIMESEWNAIIDIASILKLVENFTTELCNTKYPPVSTVIPLTRCLRYAIEVRQPMSEIGKSFQMCLINVLAQRLGGFEIDNLYSKATFLDPRFKKQAFSSLRNAEKVEQEIINELSTTLMGTSSQAGSNLQNEITDANDIWAHFDLKVAQLKSYATPRSNAETIIKHFLEVPLIPRTHDPFEYWEVNKDVFPELYKLHIKYCCCPATSISPKLLFTKQGRILSSRRSGISESRESLEMIMFLSGNISLIN